MKDVVTSKSKTFANKIGMVLTQNFNVGPKAKQTTST